MNEKISEQPSNQGSSQFFLPQNSKSGFFRTQHFSAIMSIVFISIAIYSNTLNNDFVYDDEITIVNAQIKSGVHLPKLFTREYFAYFGEMSYRPVVTLTYFIDYAIYEAKPYGYHLTNVLLHAVNGALLYIFLTHLLGYSGVVDPQRKSPLIISLLFAAHPALTEAVNAISFREDLLMFLFYMAALNIYLFSRSASNRCTPSALWFAVSCMLYFLALLSKEMALTLPAVVCFLEWVYSDKKDGRLRSILLNRYAIGYISVAVIYGYIRFYYLKNYEATGPPSSSIVEQLTLIPYLVSGYLKLALFPVSLSADYHFATAKPFSFTFIVSLISVISLIAISTALGKAEKSVFFGTGFFLITLTPVYNIVPLYNSFAERYIYLPLAGFLIAAGFIINRIFNKVFKPKVKKRYLSTLIFIILSFNFLVVVKRNEVWKDSYSLWSDTVKKLPDSDRAHNNLGYAYAAQGNHELAIQQYLTAIKLNPLFADPHYNLGNAYAALNNYELAVQQYLTAIKLNPLFAAPYNNLGNLYADQDNYELALQQYLTAIKLNPLFAEAHNNLGAVYAEQGDYNLAVKQYMKAIKLNPRDPKVHYNLANIYYDLNLYDEAILEYKTSIRLINNIAEAHYNLGLAYAKKGLKDEAEKEFKAAAMLKRGHLQVKKPFNRFEFH